MYWLAIWIRNKLYDRNILSSVSFGLPVVCIGNLSVGGTGKTPMVEFLLKHLHKDFKIATLSRGYMRKTRGYALANGNSTALDIGDEPMQFYIKYPGIPVAVGEQRVEAIPQLLQDRPETECIILDDAFQHREVKAGLNILLTDFKNLFTRDFMLPTGDLRDTKSSYRRAEVIVVTKCDPDLKEETRQELIREINPVEGQQIFFTCNKYASPYHIFRTQDKADLNPELEVLLITGIANPEPLKELLQDRVQSFLMIQYPDHHIFSIDDWKEIQEKFKKMDSAKKIILTTEKDAVRLKKFGDQLSQWPLYVIPLEHHVLFGETDSFLNRIRSFITNFNAETVTNYGKEKFKEEER